MKVFVDVDTQCDFVNANGNLYVPGAEEIKPTLSKLTKLAKDQNIPVLKTMDCHIQNDPEFKVFPPHCIKETVGQACIRETGNKKALIFEKQTYDVFDKTLGNPNFEKWIKDNKVTEAWCYGVATDYCVKAAVLGLCKLGIKVYVFVNAIAGVDPETTEEAIKEMRKAGAMFVKAGI